MAAPAPPPRPARPPCALRSVPGLAAAVSIPGGGASGHGGGCRGRRGCRRLELPRPRSEPPLPHLFTAAPSSSPSLSAPDPTSSYLRRFPPCSLCLLPPSTPQPGPGLHFSGLGSAHAGCILPGPPSPEPPSSRLSSLMVLPALGAPNTAPPSAPKASERGAGVERRRSSETRQESASAPAQNPFPNVSYHLFPFHAPPHPFSLFFAGSWPLFHPCPSPPCPLWAEEIHSLSVYARERAWNGGAEEAGQHRVGSPHAQLEGRLREESRNAGQTEPNTSIGIKNPRAPND